MSDFVLTINAGSSSVKFAVFDARRDGSRRISGKVERIGQSGSTVSVFDHTTSKSTRTLVAGANFREALSGLIPAIEQVTGQGTISAIGHRIVHGGPRYREAVIVRDSVLNDLQELSPLDPTHLPSEIELIKACSQQFPEVRQVACFDTVFHQALPVESRTVPIPRHYQSDAIRRYGFHGLSYAYLMDELERIAEGNAASGRIVLAHLGSGASLAAVKNRQCLDTTMGFTPTGGLVMGTRSGDLDPGVLIFLQRLKGLSVDQVDDTLNKQSGLLGISETSADVRDLLACEAHDVRAAEAIGIFCYQIRKFIGAFAAALSGLDTLVFSGGIGENAPEIRARICHGLEFLGIQLDGQRNVQNVGVISVSDAPVTVRVIPTDEERQIFREVMTVLEKD